MIFYDYEVKIKMRYYSKYLFIYFIFFAVIISLPSYLGTKYDVFFDLIFIFIQTIRINRLEIFFILYEYTLKISWLPSIWKLLLPISLVLIIWMPIFILSIRKINKNEFRSDITSKDGLKIASFALIYIIVISIMHFVYIYTEYFIVSNFVNGKFFLK